MDAQGIAIVAAAVLAAMIINRYVGVDRLIA